MKESDFDEVSGDDAFKLGVLTELTAIREELHRIGNALEDGETDDGTPAFQCEPCDGLELTDEREARQHAVEEHNAPSDGEAWQRIMVVNDGR